MVATTSLGWRGTQSDIFTVAAGAVFRPFNAPLAAPDLLFLGTLTVMLFRPPPLEFYSLDRIAYAVLVAFVLLRAAVLRQRLSPASALLWPMAALVLLSLTDLLARPYESELWSVAAAKFLVPYTMFYLAGLVFRDERSLRRFELFALVVLGYLIFIAIMSLTGIKELIFPKFILDESLGIHPERARGPFLQAEANGATLNMLGLIALDSYGRGRLRGIWAIALFTTLPVAILATKTRAVWLSFGASLIALAVWTPSRRVRRLSLVVVLASAIGLAFSVMESCVTVEGSVGQRLLDTGTVRFRMAAYEAGWDMFCERPLLGWGAARMRTELADRIEGFHGDTFVVHNTYFETVLEHGVIGFALYLWIAFGLARLGAGNATWGHSGEYFLQPPCRPLWFLLLGVYFVSATSVVMNYQFVNALFFSIAGILARQLHDGWRKRRVCESYNPRVGFA